MMVVRIFMVVMVLTDARIGGDGVMVMIMMTMMMMMMMMMMRDYNMICKHDHKVP